MSTNAARIATPQIEPVRETSTSTSQSTRINRKSIGQVTARKVPRVAQKPATISRAGLLGSARIQPALMISQPGDAAEAEADRMAAHVMSMSVPVGRPSQQRMASAQRSPLVAQRAIANILARAPALGAANVADADTESGVRKELTGGTPMAADVSAFFGRRFNANFSGVRIHTDSRANNLSTRLGARAFTYGSHIFFNAGQFNPETREGATLLAHELTHTIQQQAVIQRKEARTATPKITSRSGPKAQRGIVSRALNWFAERARNIPGFTLFTVVIGRNPINMEPVARSGANILRALVELIPGGALIVDALNNHGVFVKGGKFIEDQFAALGDVGASFRAALMEFVDSLGWSDIFDLGGVWDRAVRIFTTPVNRLINFGRGLVDGIAQIVKDAILKPLGRWAAANIPRWNLLVGVFGKNPISDEGESPAAALIGGFMELIGQQELWQNIQRGNAVGRAWNWFKSVLGGALALVTSIPGRVMSTIRSLTIFDIVTIVGAFGKIIGAFASFVVDFISWAGGKVLKLLEIILEVVAPAVVPYLKRAGSAFSTIIRNPIRFVRTLVRAGIQGFRQFANNFLSHLQASLVGWLTGAMAGANIYIPRGFNLLEILKFVLSILGLTWQNIRTKLVRATNETTVVALETSFEIVRRLVTEGPAAAWETIVETLGNLRQMAIDAIMEFVRNRVVQAAVTRLVSMLNPAGAFIQAIIAIYNTVMFFVERIRQIAQVAAAFVDGIAAIAAGNIAPAANRVETTMAGLLTLVISFLARIAGLGRVADAVTGLIARIRAPIDRALDRVVTWIVTQARRAGRMVMSGARGAVAAVVGWWRERRRPRLADGGTHNLYFRESAASAELRLASVDKPVDEHLQAAINDPALPDAAKQAAQRALDFYNLHFAPLKRTPPPTEVQITASIAQLDPFTAMLVAIGGATGDDTVSTPIGAFDGPRTAFLGPISNRTSRGGAESSGLMGGPWELLTARRMTNSGQRWVRMHMISAQYGGPNSMGNFIPAPSATNTGGVVRGFETQVQEILYGRDSSGTVGGSDSPFRGTRANRARIWLETRSTGFYPAASAPDGTPLYGAGVFATGAQFQVGIYSQNGSAWVKDPAARHSVSVGIDRPDFDGTFIPNINTAGPSALAAAARISSYFAGEVVAERTTRGPFANESRFIDRMLAVRDTRARGATEAFQAATLAVASAAEDGRLTWR